MRRALFAVLVVAVAGTLVAGCGDDEKKGAAVNATYDMAPSGSAFALNGPATLEGGIAAITFKNSTQATANLQLVRITGDHTVDELLKAIDSEGGPLPDWIAGGGGLGSTRAGDSNTATQQLSDGKYYFIAEQESEGEGAGPPPATMAVQVSGDAGGSLPDANATVTAKDYTFDTSGLKAGPNTILFKNDGQQFHHFIAAPLMPGKTIADAKTFFTTEGEPTGPPPIDFEAGAETGTAVIGPGQELVTSLDFKAGNWVFVCFIQDKQGGPPHVVAHDMIKEVTIS